MEVHVLVRLASLSLLFGSLACGSSTPEPASSDQSTAVDGQKRTGPAVSMDADIGALDEAKVLSTFQSAQSAISSCLTRGAERLPYLAGRVRFHVRVDQAGKATSVHLEASDIGDRTTEECMLRALSQKSWPAPEGGREGIAKTEFSFDPPGNARPAGRLVARERRQGRREARGRARALQTGGRRRGPQRRRLRRHRRQGARDRRLGQRSEGGGRGRLRRQRREGRRAVVAR